MPCKQAAAGLLQQHSKGMHMAHAPGLICACSSRWICDVGVGRVHVLNRGQQVCDVHDMDKQQNSEVLLGVLSCV
jgi:hypothetical protein